MNVFFLLALNICVNQPHLTISGLVDVVQSDRKSCYINLKKIVLYPLANFVDKLILNIVTFKNNVRKKYFGQCNLRH